MNNRDIAARRRRHCGELSRHVTRRRALALVTVQAVGTSASSAAASRVGFPPSSVRFDWGMGFLALLLMAGVIQDGWAHAHRLVDQSFLTPWHAMLYSMVSLSGIVLGAFSVRNYLDGYPVGRALPYGYSLALLGVVLFAVGGVLDLCWHTFFGIEVGAIGLISPSHLLLAVSGMLGFSGPIRSIARQYGREDGGWRKLGPMILGLLASLTALGFFTAYAQPIEDGFTARTIQRSLGTAPVTSPLSDDGAVTRTASELAHSRAGFSLAESANLIQAVLLTGILLIAVRRWRLPFGAFTIVLTIFALAMATQTDAYYDGAAALLTGLLADGAIALYGSRVRTGTGFYAFAFALPAVFFATYLVSTIVAGDSGTAWPPEMLISSPLLAGVAGLLVAFCYQPPLPGSAQSSNQSP